MKRSRKKQPTKRPARKPAPARVLGLRTCDADMRACGGFQWPTKGWVSAPDWKPEPQCGNGLHFLLWGEGDAGLLSGNKDAKWLVVEAVESEVVVIGRKAKAPRCRVVYCGERDDAVAYIAERAPGKTVVWAKQTAGEYGTATAGEYGTATAGDRGTATAGEYGTATAGYGGTATAGYGGIVVIRWWNGHRDNLAIRYVGEDGIKANTKYCCDDSGNVVEVARTESR